MKDSLSSCLSFLSPPKLCQFKLFLIYCTYNSWVTPFFFYSLPISLQNGHWEIDLSLSKWTRPPVLDNHLNTVVAVLLCCRSMFGSCATWFIVVFQGTEHAWMEGKEKKRRTLSSENDFLLGTIMHWVQSTLHPCIDNMKPWGFYIFLIKKIINLGKHWQKIFFRKLYLFWLNKTGISSKKKNLIKFFFLQLKLLTSYLLPHWQMN